MLFDVQAIFFDLGDTLVHIKPEILQTVCGKIGRSRGYPLKIDEYEIAFQKEWSKRRSPAYMHLIKGVSTHKKEIIYWESFFASLLTTLRADRNNLGFVKWLANIYSNSRAFDCFKDVHPVLAELKASRFKLGLISNAFPSADEIIKDLDIRQYFDYSLLSFESNYIKPEPEIYRFAVEKLEVEIQKTIFVDDHQGFVEAAGNLGMNAYLIERFSNQHPKLATESRPQKIYNLFQLRDTILGESGKTKRTSSHSNAKKGNEDKPLPIMPANSFAIP